LIIKKIKNFIKEKKQLSIIINDIKKKFLKKKIILVGNSKNILKNKIGKEIDKFDIVVRFNGTPIKFYKDYIGIKTDVMACNEEVCLNWCKTGIYTSESNWFKNGKIIKLNTAKFYQGQNFKKKQHNLTFVVIETNKALTKIKTLTKNKKIIFFSNSLNHILRYKIISKYNYFKKINSYLRGGNLTIGAILISILNLAKINFCIHGFDLKKKTKSYSQYYHNYTNGKTNHNFKQENKILLNLLKNKKLIFFNKSL
jgi:hypothetical protein